MEEFYSGANFIKVLKKDEGISDKGYFRPDNLVGTNCLDISVFWNDCFCFINDQDSPKNNNPRIRKVFSLRLKLLVFLKKK